MSEESIPLSTGSEHRDTSADSPAGIGSDDALLPRLRLIEDQPLENRADAYAALHDELRSRLEGADPSERRAHGTGAGTDQAKH